MTELNYWTKEIEIMIVARQPAPVDHPSTQCLDGIRSDGARRICHRQLRLNQSR